MQGFLERIDAAISADLECIHLCVADSQQRKQLHQYVKDQYGATHICRTEYMAHGAERKCCEVWHKSSNYGKSWNGGDIFCDRCQNYTNLDFDDCDDVVDEDDIRLCLYKPTDNVMVCKKSHPYKRGYRYPFSYRKHYK